MIVRNIVSRAQFQAEKMGKADLASASQLFAGLNCFEPGQEHALHTHAGQDKLYLILEGEGEAVIGDETHAVGPGDLLLAVAEQPHAMRNTGAGRLIVLAVLAPPPKPKRA